MANKKKSFAKGIDAILGGSSSSSVLEEEPKKEETPVETEPPKMVTKVTLRLEDELLDTVRALAYWERTSMTDVVSEALKTHFKALGEERIESALSAHKG